MSRGQIQPDLRCLVKVELRDSYGVFRGVEAKLDTGFTGDVALPHNIFAELGATTTSKKKVTLADGTEKEVVSCSSSVKLGPHELEATILDFGNSKQPLIGIRILMGFSIQMDVRPFGDILFVPTEDT